MVLGNNWFLAMLYVSNGFKTAINYSFALNKFEGQLIHYLEADPLGNLSNN